MYARMKKNVLLITLINILMTTGINAQSLRQMWLAMPDSLTPYLNQNQRSMLLDYYEMGGDKEIKNAFEGISRIDTLARDFISVQLSNAVSLQIAMLPNETGDSLACVVRTFQSPARESEVSIYSHNWELIQQVSIDSDSLFSCPDTMSTVRFVELKDLLKPRMTYATYSPVDNMLTFCLSIPFIFSDDKEELKNILLQRNLKWDGKMFKECYIANKNN